MKKTVIIYFEQYLERKFADAKDYYNKLAIYKFRFI